MELEQIRKTARQGKEDPLYLRLEKDVAIDEKSLAALKEKLQVPARKEAELALRGRRVDGTLGVNDVDNLHSEASMFAERRGTGTDAERTAELCDR